MQKKRIFVFGSNLAGIHGAGSARAAREQWGARLGVGVGRTGDAYAIPTKDARLKTLPLKVIGAYVVTFLEYAQEHPELEFEVVKIGCGLAGFREEEIAPFFSKAPQNVNLPTGWRR
jgi:hypothetical protein